MQSKRPKQWCTWRRYLLCIVSIAVLLSPTGEAAANQPSQMYIPSRPESWCVRDGFDRVWDLYREFQFQEVVEAFEFAVLRYKAEKRWLDYGLCSMALGFVQTQLSDYQAALKNFSEGAAQWRKLGIFELEAAAEHFIGVIYGALGDSKRAVEHLNQAYGIRRFRQPDIEGAAETSNQLGLIYQSLGQYDLAFHYFDDARQWSSYSNLIGRALNNISHLHYRRGQAAQASSKIDCTKNFDPDLPIWLVERVFKEAGTSSPYYPCVQYVRARDYAQQALSCLGNLSDSRDAGYTLNNWGLAELALGRYGEARSHFRSAREVALGAGDRLLEGLALANLGRLES